MIAVVVVIVFVLILVVVVIVREVAGVIDAVELYQNCQN